ncbi:MAG: response regulator [Myxococcota bacterium]
MSHIGTLELLHVDDEASARRVVRRLFTSRGHRVESCSTPKEALQAQRFYDVAILDFDLGADLDGLELARRLLADARCGAVVFFTACDDCNRWGQAEKWGVVVSKTESPVLLVGTVHQAAAGGRRAP